MTGSRVETQPSGTSDTTSQALMLVAAKFSGALYRECGIVVDPKLISELLTRFHLAQHENLEARVCFLERLIATNLELFRPPLAATRQ